MVLSVCSSCADGLSGEHRAARGKTDVHHADEHERNDRAVQAELHAAGDHLRQAELRTLRAVQRHHRAADDLADEQPDQRPEHVAAEHDRKRADDDRRDLQIRAEPQGELAEQTAVALGVGNIVDRAALDQRGVRGECRGVMFHARLLSGKELL